MMEKLTVDSDGKIIIPPEVIQKRGLHPGDELTLIESAEGLLVYHGGVDEKLRHGGTARRKAGLLAQDDALRYENLSEHERDVIWNQEAEFIEIEAENDELDLQTN